MKIFLDTADTDVIRAHAQTGLVDGITTNPSIIAKSGRDFHGVIKEICDLVAGPVSAEVIAEDAPGMLKEAETLADLAENVTIKLPLTLEGLTACGALSAKGVKTNVTLCFSANQALLAAKAGATFVSPFIGRLDDLGEDGLDLIADIRAIYDAHGFATEILAASIRSPKHVTDCAKLGADAITLPPALFEACAKHPLTDKGLAAFLADWRAAKG